MEYSVGGVSRAAPKLTDTTFNELTAALLDSPRGRKWLKLLRDKAGRVHIKPDEPNPYAAVYKEGRLALIKTIEKTLKGDIDDED